MDIRKQVTKEQASKLHDAGFKIQTEKQYFLVLNGDDTSEVRARRKHKKRFNGALVEVNVKAKPEKLVGLAKRMFDFIDSTTTKGPVSRQFLAHEFQKKNPDVAKTSLSSTISRLIHDKYLIPTKNEVAQ